jgi:hypothetical protein
VQEPDAIAASAAPATDAAAGVMAITKVGFLGLVFAVRVLVIRRDEKT